jgi:hypothetical protein
MRERFRNQTKEEQINLLKRAVDIQGLYFLLEWFSDEQLDELFYYLWASGREPWIMGEVALEIESREWSMSPTDEPSPSAFVN